MKGYISEWDGKRAVGPALYTSDVVTGDPAYGMEKITFNTSGIQLDHTKQYVAFLSVSELFDGIIRRRVALGGKLDNLYSGGTFVFQNNGSDVSAWTNQDWVVDSHNDAKFVASFSVNEPNILSLLPLVSFLVPFRLVKKTY